MNSNALALAVEKMRNQGVNEAAIAVFSRQFAKLASGATGMIAESEIAPVADPTQFADLTVSEAEAQAALAKTAVIKLNGGLGTSMGLAQAKTLLPVRDGQTFLDIIVTQVLAARQRYGVSLPLLFMNSFNTEADTLAALSVYPQLAVPGVPLSFVQSQEPKLRADNLEPVSWPANPRLEWCPPGHGDIYPSLLATGTLAALRAAGYRYAFVSNSDNLGATVSPEIAGWFAGTELPFVSEITRRTPMDVKGGHLAIRRADNQLILRETAQTPAADLKFFTDPNVHPYAHCNNLWLNLDLLDEVLTKHGLVDLPLIRNAKTVDPKDRTSTPVIQIESAMGAAVEIFPGAAALAVPRSRFLPVKSTNELLLVRSDVYDFTADGFLVQTTDALPVIDLDKQFFQFIADFEARFPTGVPSLRRVETLRVAGDHTFVGTEAWAGQVSIA